jgi:hypothetical protein
MRNMSYLYTNKIILSILLVFTISITLIAMIKIDDKDSIRRIKINYNLPILKPEGGLLNIKSDFNIFYENENVLFKLPLVHTYENETEVFRVDTTYNYLVFRKGDKYGLWYEYINTKKHKIVLVDSILTSRAFKNLKLYSSNDSLISSISVSGKQKSEKYVPKLKLDYSYGDTTYISYSNEFKNIDYSFCKELESAKNLKICKMEVLYNSQFYKGFPLKFPERKISFEMRELPVIKSDSIGFIFDKFKNDLRTIKQ